MGQRICAVVSDLDGTFWWGQEQLHPTTPAAVRDLKDAGIQLLFATGRRYASARQGLVPYGLAGPAVLMSGAVGADLTTGEEWHRQPFDPADALAILDAFDGEGLNPVVYVCDARTDTVVTTGCSTHLRHLQNLGHPTPVDPKSVIAEGRAVGFGVIGLDV